MSEGLEGLYREIILDHARRRHGHGLADERGAASSHQRNPICGDELTVRVRAAADGSILDVTWAGDGCSISQASASMLAELATGLETAEASRLIDGFREALRSRGTVELDEDDFGDAAALSGVSRYTARVKCAMLAWVALEDALTRLRPA